MALKTFVKISNINNLSDARYCAGMMVDVLGFNIDPTSDSFVSEGDFAEITDWVAGVKFAGEFKGASLDQIKEAAKLYRLDYIQISDINIVEQVGLLGKPLIVCIEINSESELTELKSNLSYLDELAEMVIIKSSAKRLFDEIDAQISYYNGSLRLLKGFGIEENNDLGKFPGLELEATEEDRPGFKDYGQIMDVLELIEED
ncbi:hypothetical protein [Ekhidna sp.]|uniref:hypothetical protein n=1 Tax=Ekhidna sp. TaxID=2608089 RepID=UPI0032EAF2EA